MITNDNTLSHLWKATYCLCKQVHNPPGKGSSCHRHWLKIKRSGMRFVFLLYASFKSKLVPSVRQIPLRNVMMSSRHHITHKPKAVSPKGWEGKHCCRLLSMMCFWVRHNDVCRCVQPKPCDITDLIIMVWNSNGFCSFILLSFPKLYQMNPVTYFGTSVIVPNVWLKCNHHISTFMPMYLLFQLSRLIS